MGLDNGIYVKATNISQTIKELAHFKEAYETNYHICYWRKCWNIRKGILDIVDPDRKCSDEYLFQLSADNLDKIITYLKSLNRKNWIDNGNSIWEFKDIKYRLRGDAKNLQELKKLMNKYSLEVYFYDSY